MKNIWRRTGVSMLALGVLTLFASYWAPPDGWWWLTAFLIANAILLIPPIRRALFQDEHHIFSDNTLIFSFFYVFYFVIGASLLSLGPDEQVKCAQSFFWTDVPLALKATAVNGVGFGLALIFSTLLPESAVVRWCRRVVESGRGIPKSALIMIFISIGTACYLDVWRHGIGNAEGVVSGTILTASMLRYVGIILAASYKGRGGIAFLVLAVAVSLASAASGALLLGKSNIIFPLLALVIGLMQRVGAKKIALPGAAAMLIVLAAFGPVVSHARVRYAFDSSADISDKARYIWSDLFNSNKDSLSGDYPLWARLCYLTAQGAAISYRDSGQGADEFSKIFWIFVPRLLFPDKPNLTQAGLDFNAKVIGSNTTSTGFGIFADGYYNAGWVGVVLVGVIVGQIVGLASLLAFEIYQAQSMLLLPLALMGNFMAFRIDGNFITDYCGLFVFIVYIMLAMRLMSRRA